MMHSLGYVGPGPALNMAWALIALLGTIALAVLSLLLWPVRMLIRWMRGGNMQEAAPVSEGAAGKPQ